jgi:hypothetical protein
VTLSIALGARATMLDGFETFMGGGLAATLVIRQTNLVLATFVLNNPPFAVASNDSMILTTPPISATADASGNANNFLLNNQTAVLALSGTISGLGGGGDIEAPSVAITTGVSQRLNTFILRMASTGLLSVEASFTFV